MTSLKTNGEKYGSQPLVTASSHTTRYRKNGPIIHTYYGTGVPREKWFPACLLTAGKDYGPEPMVWGSAITTERTTLLPAI